MRQDDGIKRVSRPRVDTVVLVCLTASVRSRIRGLGDVIESLFSYMNVSCLQDGPID